MKLWSDSWINGERIPARFAAGKPSEQTSKDGGGKGPVLSDNLNPHLAWAFHEAAHFAIRYLPAAQRYYQRKARERNAIVVLKALAHKLARACYYVLRDGVAFEPDR